MMLTHIRSSPIVTGTLRNVVQTERAVYPWCKLGVHLRPFSKKGEGHGGSCLDLRTWAVPRPLGKVQFASVGVF
eukprot:10865050-Heterocapsa_arctica.AAC.1